jgi:hypothetical protein
MQIVPTELEEHLLLADWLNLNNIFFVHIPNEGQRSIATAARLKRMGMRKGAPDFMIFGGSLNVAIELKRQKRSKTSREQIEFLERLEELGWTTKLCYGAQDAIGFLTTLSLKKRPTVRVCQSSFVRST